MMTLKAARQACLATILSAVSASAEPAHPAAEGLPAIAAELRELAMTRSRQVHDAVLTGLQDCLPEDAQPSLSTPEVKDLIVDLHLYYFELASQTMTEADRRRKFAIAMESGSRGLSDDRRKDLQLLRLQSIEQGLKLLCVAVTARGILNEAE